MCKRKLLKDSTCTNQVKKIIPDHCNINKEDFSQKGRAFISLCQTGETFRSATNERCLEQCFFVIILSHKYKKKAVTFSRCSLLSRQAFLSFSVVNLRNEWLN